MVILVIASTPACFRHPGKGRIESMIEPYKQLSHPLFYWETTDGKTDLYRIAETTSSISPLLKEQEGLLDVKSARNGTYILSKDRGNYLFVSRLESDRDVLSPLHPEHTLMCTDDNPVWAVAREDKVAIAASDGNKNYILILTPSRKEGETNPLTGEVAPPIITWDEAEWRSSDEPVLDLSVSPNGSMIAFTEALEDGTGKALFILDAPNQPAKKVGDKPVVELGDFSPDGTKLLATLKTTTTVEVAIIDTDSIDIEMQTNSASGYVNKAPAWHPGGQYIIYSTDFTSTFTQNATELSGEQLYLYSLASMNARRLTAFRDMTLWVDFAPNGDFLLYSSSPGVPGRQGGRGAAQGGSTQPPSGPGNTSGLETWRLYVVPWVPDNFKTSNLSILTPDEMEFLVNWTQGAGNDVHFIWGPGD
jgi:hypothetical protein